jgi:hypothetical protein
MVQINSSLVARNVPRTIGGIVGLLPSKGISQRGNGAVDKGKRAQEPSTGTRYQRAENTTAFFLDHALFVNVLIAWSLLLCNGWAQDWAPSSAPLRVTAKSRAQVGIECW